MGNKTDTNACDRQGRGLCLPGKSRDRKGPIAPLQKNGGGGGGSERVRGLFLLNKKIS